MPCTWYHFDKGRQEIACNRCSLFVRRSQSAVVHHVPKEDNNVWLKAGYGMPALAKVEVDDELGEAHEPSGTTRIGPRVKNLRICNEEDMCLRKTRSERRSETWSIEW